MRQHYFQPAGAQILRDMPQGMDSDALSGNARISQQLPVIALEFSLHTYRVPFAIGVVQAPDVLATVAAKQQQAIVIGQSLERLWITRRCM